MSRCSCKVVQCTTCSVMVEVIPKRSPGVEGGYCMIIPHTLLYVRCREGKHNLSAVRVSCVSSSGMCAPVNVPSGSYTGS